MMKLCLGFAAGLLALTGTAQAQPSYRLVKTIAIGAPDRWDYVVYDRGRAYIAHGDVLTGGGCGGGQGRRHLECGRRDATASLPCPRWAKAIPMTARPA